MTLAKGPDPVKPMITFDNYIIPDTVREVRKPRGHAPTASPMGSYFSQDRQPNQVARMMPIALVVLATFVLGVMTSLYFANSPQAALAQADQPVLDQPMATAALAEMTPLLETVQPAAPPAEEQPEEDLAPVLASGTALLEQAVAASLQQQEQQDVTRQDSADLIAPTGAMSQPDLSDVSLAAILTGLTPIRVTGVDAEILKDKPFLNRDVLDTLRENVLAGTYMVKTVERNGVKRLCLRVPHAEVSQDQAADLLQEAAERGEIVLPEAISTSDGNFDADTLIFNLVQTSLANDGTAAGAEAAREMSRRAFIASNAKTSIVLGERYYVVKPGDSLAYLSLQFYGKPSDYLKIYQANRGILRSPDLIQIGQRLIIPG